VTVALSLTSPCDFPNAERLGIGESSQVPFLVSGSPELEDLAFGVFLLQIAESLLPEVVCSLFLSSLPPVHPLINPLIEVRSRPPLFHTC
jgi:hypothetical protein